MVYDIRCAQASLILAQLGPLLEDEHLRTLQARELLLPAIRRIPPRPPMAAAGISRAYVSVIKAGRRVPPRFVLDPEKPNAALSALWPSCIREPAPEPGRFGLKVIPEWRNAVFCWRNEPPFVDLRCLALAGFARRLRTRHRGIQSLADGDRQRTAFSYGGRGLHRQIW